MSKSIDPRSLPKSSPAVDPRISAEVRRVLQAFKEQLDVGSGFSGRKEHRWLRAVDLENAGLGRFNPNANGGIGGIEPPGGGGSGQTNRPTTPQNVTVRGGYDWIHVYWDMSHGWPTTEVWRASGSDNIADAVLVGTVGNRGSQYADFDVTYGVTYYYWVRFVGEDGIPGPFVPPNGIAGKIVEAPEAMLSQLQGRIRSTQLHSTLNNYIEGIEVKADHANNQYTIKIGSDGAIAGFGLGFTSPNYNPSIPSHSMALFNVDTFAVYSPTADALAFAVETVWDEGLNQFVTRVVMDGAHMSTGTITDAAIKNATITNASIADATITGAKIKNATITAAKFDSSIESDNYIPGVDGWIIYRDTPPLGAYQMEIGSLRARGDIEATSIRADAANIVDTLNIAGKAVSALHIKVSGADVTRSTTAWYTLLTSNVIDYKAGMQGVMVNAVVQVTSEHSFPWSEIRIVRNGSTQIGAATGQSLGDGHTSSQAVVVYDPSPGTSPTYSLQCRSAGGTNRFRVPIMFVEAAYR